MESGTEAARGLWRLYPDALEDSYVAVYCLLVVAPLSALASRWLLARGKQTTPRQVLLVSLLVPTVLIGIPAALYWFFSERNVYQLLQMSRTESRYVWAQKYAFWRNLFQTGEMPPLIWQHIDSAYDNIYNEETRFLYDFWGPEQTKMTLREAQSNLALFYLLWTAIIYSLTSPKAAEAGSKWAYTGLIMLLAFEVAVKLVRYDPALKTLFPYITPREFVMWGHRLFPIFAFAAVSVKRVFYVDMDQHHQQILQHLKANNERAKQELKTIEQTLAPDDEEDESAT